MSNLLGNRLYEFQRSVDNLGNLPIIWSQYETLVARALASGKLAPKLVDVYGLDLLRELGFTHKTIREADARVDAMNQKLQATGLLRNERLDSTDTRREATPLPTPSETGTASTPTPNPSDDDRGGVITDVIIKTEQADLRQKRKAILKAIRSGQLATDLPMKEGRSHAP